MYYYFSASFDAVIKLNGTYFGKINDTIKFIDLSDFNTFVEVCSLSPTDKSLNFILDENFLNNPPPYCSVTDMKGGYLIKFNRSYSFSEFKVIGQKRFDGVLATVFADGGVKISIETNSDFFAEDLKFMPYDVKFYTLLSADVPLLVAVLYGETMTVNAYRLATKINRVISLDVNDCQVDNVIHTVLEHDDILKHTVKSEWRYIGDKFSETNRSVNRKKELDLTSTHVRLIPYLFLEEFLVGGNWQEFLADNVKENADKLSGYLGNFVGVMPPPTFRSLDEVGLVYKMDDRRYLVEYFTFETLNKKITNLKKVDN